MSGEKTPAAATSALHTPVLYDCQVTHHRHEGIDRKFAHRVRLWLVDVDDVPTPRFPLALLVRFRAADHLGDPGRTLRANVDHYLRGNGVDLHGGRVLMLAQARALGYVFDPVTLFWCHDATCELVAVIVEVRNTFGERHCYLLSPDATGRAEVAKEFYVSPMFPVDGRYVMRFQLRQDHVEVSFVLRRRPDGDARLERTALTATIRGTAVTGTLRRALLVLAHPFDAYRTIVLIHRESRSLLRSGLRVRRRRYHPPQQGVTPQTQAAGAVKRSPTARHR